MCCLLLVLAQSRESIHLNSLTDLFSDPFSRLHLLQCYEWVTDHSLIRWFVTNLRWPKQAEHGDREQVGTLFQALWQEKGPLIGTRGEGGHTEYLSQAPWILHCINFFSIYKVCKDKTSSLQIIIISPSILWDKISDNSNTLYT